MKHLKTVSISLTALIMLLATACGNGGQTPPASGGAESPASAAPEQSPSSREASEASETAQTKPFFIVSNTTVTGYPETWEDNLCIQEVERQSGYQFRVEAYSGDEYATKIQLYISSGDMPDMWYARNVDDALLWKEQEVIMPLTALYEEYGTDMRPYIYDDAVKAFTFDGELWAIPSMYNTSSPGSQPNQNGPIVRKDWLDRLGMEIPETLDDYYEMIVAFTSGDPDGNGKKDTWGMGMTKDILGSSFHIVYNALGVVPDYWTQRDGKIVKGFMTDEFTQAVEILRQWYGEGLIDPEFPIMATNNLEEKSVNSIVGSFYGNAWQQDSASDNEKALRQLTPDADLLTIAPLTGPEGHGGNPAAFSSWRSIVISATCEQPELLADFCNWFSLHEENWMLSEHGVRGTHWDWGTDGKFERIPPYDATEARYREGWSNCTRIQTMTDRRSQTTDVLDAINTSNQQLIGNEFWGSVPAMMDYPDIQKDVEETVMKVVQGELPLEEITAMQQRYLDRGGALIEEQVNEIWSSMQ